MVCGRQSGRTAQNSSHAPLCAIVPLRRFLPRDSPPVSGRLFMYDIFPAIGSTASPWLARFAQFSHAVSRGRAITSQNGTAPKQTERLLIGVMTPAGKHVDLAVVEHLVHQAVLVVNAHTANTGVGILQALGLSYRVLVARNGLQQAVDSLNRPPVLVLPINVIVLCVIVP